MASQGELRLPSAVGKRRAAGRNIHCSGVGFKDGRGRLRELDKHRFAFP